MLDAFAGLGAKRFDVTFKTMETEDREFRKGVPLDVLHSKLPLALDQSILQQRNVIVRPIGDRDAPVFLQLDDLDTATLERVKPISFLTLKTSPGSHQAWLALEGPTYEDFGSRLRRGSGADRYASGASRVAGSYNFKPRYAPDFPIVVIDAISPGRTVTAAVLQSLGLVAAAEPINTPTPHRARYDRKLPAERRWPDYQKCLDGAPANAAGDGPKRALADFTWCMTAADWGFSLEATVARLMEQSSKAQENGKGYALKTATKAAQAAARNRGLARRQTERQP